MLTPDKVIEAAAVTKAWVHRTPVFTSKWLNELAKRELFFKAECLQKTGSFKARGAIYAVSKLVQNNPGIPGVITHSSGNHGQALAYAAQCFGIPCTVIVPNNAPTVKIEAMKAYGAKVVLCQPTTVDRVSCCEEVAGQTGQVMVHPHDDPDIIAGQGTMCVELLEECPDLDAILVPVGGGGMVSGVALWAKHKNPAIKVYCVEPLGKDLERSLRAGKPLWPDPPGTLDTVADGIRTQRIGHHCFPLVAALCQHTVLTVDDAEIMSGMKLVWERLKLVIEPSSGTTLGAVMSNRFREIADAENLKKIGLILCGGNLDLNQVFHS